MIDFTKTPIDRPWTETMINLFACQGKLLDTQYRVGQQVMRAMLGLSDGGAATVARPGVARRKYLRPARIAPASPDRGKNDGWTCAHPFCGRLPHISGSLGLQPMEGTNLSSGQELRSLGA